MNTRKAGQKIVIIGCGNVAWHLARRFKALKYFSVFVYNHAPNKALADFETDLNCVVTVGLDNISADADFYFICVSDQFIPLVSRKIKGIRANAVILHTSGSAELSAIINPHKNKAVFYPLQTFSKHDKLNWKKIPVIIESTNGSAEKRTGKLAELFSSTHIFLNYKERLTLHLAAVFVNNFTNALYVAASEITGDKKLKINHFDLLLPLIKQTNKKIQTMPPLAAQTGPAKRNDLVTLEKHTALLSGKPDLKKLYLHLSQLIFKQQSNA